MDVHSTNFTLCSFEPGYGFEADKIFGQTQIKEDIFNSTVKYIIMIQMIFIIHNTIEIKNIQYISSTK